MARLLQRELEVDLLDLGQRLLTHQPAPAEVVLEFYRWVAVTATQRGRRWSASDPDWRRFPGICEELGLRQWAKYPLVRYDFSLNFLTSSRDFMPKVADVIARLAFGGTPQITRWRRRCGSRRCAMQCRVLKRSADRWSDPLIVSALGTRKDKLTVSFNSIHKRARRLYYFKLVPSEEGWHLEIVYGIGDPKRGAVSAWSAYNNAWDDVPASSSELARIPTQLDGESVSEFFERVRSFCEDVLES